MLHLCVDLRVTRGLLEPHGPRNENSKGHARELAHERGEPLRIGKNAPYVLLRTTRELSADFVEVRGPLKRDGQSNDQHIAVRAQEGSSYFWLEHFCARGPNGGALNIYI